MEDRFKDINDWFDFMNNQFAKIEEAHHKSKINNILIDNDIDPIQ